MGYCAYKLFTRNLGWAPRLQITLSVAHDHDPNASRKAITLAASPASVVRCQLAVISVLSAASVAAHVYAYAFRQRSFFTLFDLEAEGNLSTWFASTSLLGAAALLFTISRMSQSALAGKWKLLAALFLYIAIDEAAQLHEFTILPLRKTFQLGGIFYFSWVVLAIPFILFLAILYFSFIRALPARVRRLALLAAAVYLSGALAMEMLNGAHAELHGYKTLIYKLMTDFEESLEMLGIALWIFALLVHLEALAGASQAPHTRPATAAQ